MKATCTAHKAFKIAAVGDSAAYYRWEVTGQLVSITVSMDVSMSINFGQSGGNCLLKSGLRVCLDFNSF